MKNRPIQYFSDEYLEQCKLVSHEQILEFLEQFRELTQNQEKKTKLISLRVPENLLEAFKMRAKLEGVPYQTKIVQLLRDYLIIRE